METKKTVTVNGRAYDAATGTPFEQNKSDRSTQKQKRPLAARAASATSSGKTAAGSVHGAPQRSTTLHRRATKKPGLPKRPQPGRHMDIARSGTVKRFASHPAPNQPTSKKAEPSDTPARTHPVATKAHAKAVAKKHPAQHVSSKEKKNAAISAHLSQPSQPKKAERRPKTKRTRRLIMIAGILTLIIGAGTLAYFQLPSISVAIAAQQAGVDAEYPGYVPTGYSLAQPVTYSDGEVELRFTSNSGTGEYTIAQASSSWDSAAVLDNVVRPASGDNYIVTQERGLTMYSFDGNAAWVNGGVFYTIESEAALSGDQIRRIATSL